MRSRYLVPHGAVASTRAQPPPAVPGATVRSFLTVHKLRRAATVVVLGLLVLFGADAGSALASSPPTYSSPNWSGFLTSSPSSGIEGAYGSWVVPSVSCPSTGTYASSIWAGIGGNTAVSYEVGGVEWLYQSGTEQECSNGHASYYGWTEEADGEIPFPSRKDEQIVGHNVYPGDVMTSTAVQHILYTLVTLKDVRNGHVMWTTSRHFYLTQTQHEYAGHTSECIVETPTVNGSFSLLADFGTLTFNYCQDSNSSGAVYNFNGAEVPRSWQPQYLYLSRSGSSLDRVTVGTLSVRWLSSGQTSTPPPSGTGSTPPTGSTPQSIQIAWSSSYPTWITMTLSGFSPGGYTYSCDFASGGDASYPLTVTSNPETIDNGHTCYDTDPGDTVWVTIGSVSSNTITVASSTPPPPPPAQTYPEATGDGPVHTWGDPNGPSGSEGPTLSANTVYQVACVTTGTAEGPAQDPYWYLISGTSDYGSADAFCDEGGTTCPGGFAGTPDVDPSVPHC